MRRIGVWVALVLLLAGIWGVVRWLGDARSTEAPAASPVELVTARGETPEPDLVADEALSRDVARADEGLAPTPTSAREAESEGFEIVCGARVVDMLDMPIAGARVWVPSRETIAAQATDAEGRCRIRGDAGALMLVGLAVAAEGYFPAEGMLVGQPELVVHLRRAAQASGRVLERATRAPVVGARVSSTCTGGDTEAGFATTDASGRFEGLTVPTGASFVVDVQARGYLWPRPRSMSIAGDPEHPASALELLLDPARPGYFLVVDGEDGRPLAGARVSVGRSTLATDAEGRVCFESALRPADLVHAATVEAEDHCGATFEVQGSGTSAAPVVLRLPRACRVEGVVRAAGGEALPPCRLSVGVEREVASELRRSGRLPDGPDSAVWPDNAKWAEGFLRTTFDGQGSGRFEIDRVPPGLPGLELVLYVDPGTLAARRIGPLGASGTTLHVDWTLEPEGTAGLAGRVLLNGEPHAAFVRVERGGIERVTTTGDDGLYAFEKLSAGSLQLRCELRGENTRWGDVGVQTSTVEVAQGEVTRRDLEFRLAVGTIRGTLSDARGAPLSGVRLRASNRAHQVESWCESERDGSWSFRVPYVETPYLLSCSRPLREAGLEVPAGTEGVALHELARGRLRFRALDAATGEVLTSVALARSVAGNLAQSIGGPNWPAMELSGWCEKELTAGPIELAAFTHDGVHRADRRQLEIPVDGVCEVEFRLGPASSVELRLAPEGGPLPEDHLVQLLPETEWELSTAELGQGYPRASFAALPFDPTRQQDLRLWPGRGILVGSLAPGRYRFKAFPDDVVITPEWIDVPSDGVVEVSWASKP